MSLSVGNLTLSYSLDASGETEGDEYDVHILESQGSDLR